MIMPCKYFHVYSHANDCKEIDDLKFVYSDQIIRMHGFAIDHQAKYKKSVEPNRG